MDEQQTALAQSVIDRLGVRIAVEPVALRDSPNGDGRRMYQYRATVSRAAAPDRRFSFDLWAIQEVDQDLENPTLYNAVECLAAHSRAPDGLLPHQVEDLTSFAGKVTAFFTDEERTALRRFRRAGS